VPHPESRKALAVQGEILLGKHLDQRPHFQRRRARVPGRRGGRRRWHGAEHEGQGRAGKGAEGGGASADECLEQ